jgi:hypothetical protein
MACAFRAAHASGSLMDMQKPIRPLLAMLLLCVAACGGSDSNATPSQAGSAAGSGGNASPSTLPSCDATCPGVLGAKCMHGPVSQADCVSGCETVRASKCAAEYDALYQCGGAKPTYSCDPNGQVSLSGCDSAAAAMYTCLSKL